MAKIPFKVSARTARLIGRENIASSKGAIIELVKNAYDADSPVCIVYFSTNSLYIIDFGEGMTQSIIINHWMTIGTNNKENDYFTKTGRVKAGAKGIGRFALDKLGTECELVTKFNEKVHKDFDEEGNETNYKAYRWKVNWNDFEGEFKTIDKVEADLTGYDELNLKVYIKDHLANKKIDEILNDTDFISGTVLHISNLRDNWEDYFIEQLYSDLEVLIPPKEHGNFKLYLFSENDLNKYGEVLGSICDDYDYKLVAKADEKQNVSIKIFRNEYDLETINPKLFERDFFQKEPYTKNDFKRGYWEINTSFSKLIPGYKDVDKDNILSQIGTFDFTFYFMKRTYSTPDLEKFFYNKFNSNERKDWLNKFGGIKIFRDEFRVRPYGEVKDSAFDWLRLGARKATSPAPTSHQSGSWKAEPDNVAGAINITRVSNLSFQDKSSREGLQENEIFKVFQNIILKIISKFEEDRAKIARQMWLFYEDVNTEARNRKQAEDLAKRILEKNSKNKSDSTNESNNANSDEEDSEKVILAQSLRDKDEEIEKLEDEQKMLRGMASSGIVVASFAHELGNLKDILTGRVDDLKDLLLDKAPESLFIDTPSFLNPYILLEEMKVQDNKLQNWLNFSLSAAKKDKRKRKKIYVKSYLDSIGNNWNTILKNRFISLNMEYNSSDDIDMRVFEIDLDSIFNNLIVNSIDAFMIQKNNASRTINIKQFDSEKEIIFDYFDNGTGLSEDITNPQDIFEPLYTTKRNRHTGEEIGTGLGMWLVKTIMKEYDGTIKLLYPQNGGFGIRLTFIKKYKKG
ncbi:sensor histidine kinase [Aliarcobacter butzleri]|uniref:sensor histidine kinase n=1 Tax=Aliarcobacter butzleri TaxID=28197 RepID=UPI0021B33EFD|nr:sensor histidine kinase [Aliarcobacter butzleri]MCT7567826.1 ATP-binding protein [Aliarcobacter butzleri]